MQRFFRSLPLPDEVFSQIQYFQKFHRFANLKSPETFNEKIQWRKLFGSDYQKTEYVDKLAVREIVKDKIGAEYLVPLISSYTDAHAIDWETLPNQFVIKATHGSGWVSFCRDKSILDKQAVEAKCANWLRTNFYRFAREPVYKSIVPRLMIEEYLDPDSATGVLDYKFFCFFGKARFIQVDAQRFTDHRRNMYDLDWNQYPVVYDHPNTMLPVEKPAQLAEMIRVAEKLAESHSFVRVDLYLINSHIYFGELTFYPIGGIGVFTPPSFDQYFGQFLDLS
jgi:hypothetical protein